MNLIFLLILPSHQVKFGENRTGPIWVSKVFSGLSDRLSRGFERGLDQ